MENNNKIETLKLIKSFILWNIAYNIYIQEIISYFL